MLTSANVVHLDLLVVVSVGVNHVEVLVVVATQFHSVVHHTFSNLSNKTLIK